MIIICILFHTEMEDGTSTANTLHPFFFNRHKVHCKVASPFHFLSFICQMQRECMFSSFDEVRWFLSWRSMEIIRTPHNCCYIKDRCAIINACMWKRYWRVNGSFGLLPAQNASMPDSDTAFQKVCFVQIMVQNH